MIISCEQCRTRFRLDDSKVSENGVKVRCAKCRHIFTVYKEGDTAPASDTITATPPERGATEPWQPTTPSSEADLMEPAVADLAVGQEDFQQRGEADFTLERSTVSEPFQDMFDLGETDASLEPSMTGTDSNAALTVDDDATVIIPPPRSATPPPPEQPVDDSGITFDFGNLEDNSEQDFGEIDFGTVPEPVTGSAETEFRFDLSEVALQPATTAGSEEVDLSAIDFGELSAAAPVRAENIDLGGLDFGAVAVPLQGSDTAAIDDPPPLETAAKQQVEKQIFSFEAPETGAPLPPPAVPSRHRQGSMLSVVIILVTLLVLAVLGYICYSFISGGPKSLQLFGKGNATVEEGRITVQNLSAYYLPNAAAGELLVINGDAVNLYKTSRAALQVRGTILGGNNQKLATKTAFAGNRLTDKQLLEMTAEKIDAAMNNQFGDSLINLEVPAGRPIPFTIVFVNPPAEGKDFGVEPVGSTVAAVK